MRAVDNPPNPFESHHRELLEAAPDARVDVYEDHPQSILSRNDSPDLPFRWSVNPYRGCFHACAYCYARPSHEYWGFGAGTDFESKLVVKPNAAALLRQALLKPSWKGELILFSGNTDCYQPLEAQYGITRACLQVCAEVRNPVAIITKGTLLLRDEDLLQRLHETAWLRVYVTLPFADTDMARALEPHVPSPQRRLDMIRRLTSLGISVGISLAPVIPGLNHSDIPRLLQAAREAGATEAFMTMLRLPGHSADVFWTRLAQAYPDRVARVRARILAARPTQAHRAAFHDRLVGHDETWRTVEQLFRVTCRTLGFQSDARGQEASALPSTFRRPDVREPQLSLFPQDTVRER
ncbi:MAG: radical SAM protein [Nitrospiraceae bacterium]